MNKWVKILIIILAVLFVLSIAKDMIIKIAVEKGVELVTGLPLKMSSLKVGIVNTMVGIKGLALSNPKSFKDRTMMDAPEIYVHYDLPAVIRGKIHVQRPASYSFLDIARSCSRSFRRASCTLKFLIAFT